MPGEKSSRLKINFQISGWWDGGERIAAQQCRQALGDSWAAQLRPPRPCGGEVEKQPTGDLGEEEIWFRFQLTVLPQRVSLGALGPEGNSFWRWGRAGRKMEYRDLVCT